MMLGVEVQIIIGVMVVYDRMSKVNVRMAMLPLWEVVVQHGPEERE